VRGVGARRRNEGCWDVRPAVRRDRSWNRIEGICGGGAFDRYHVVQATLVQAKPERGDAAVGGLQAARRLRAGAASTSSAKAWSSETPGTTAVMTPLRRRGR
jgi:hypothetical protein